MPHPLIFFFIGILLLVFLFRKPKVLKKNLEEWLPPELKTAEIYSVEKKLSITGKFNIQGKADRVYKLKAGELVLVERKNRSKKSVSLSDQLQLSLYAYMLKINGNEIAPFGFVIFQGEDFAQKVPLLSIKVIERKLDHYKRIKAGLEKCKKRKDFRCKSCSHLSRCL